MTPPAFTREDRRVWTREVVIERIQRWVVLYGEPPRAADLSPASARWSGSSWRTDRYRAGDPETGAPWPSLNAVKSRFDGSLNAAIIAAGFEPNRPGPPSRRVSAEPDIEDRVVMSPVARVLLDSARADLAGAQERVRITEGKLARARAANVALDLALQAARRARKATMEKLESPVPVSRTVVRERVVKEHVADPRAERRAVAAEKRAEEAEALARVEVAQARAALRSLARSRETAEKLREQLAEQRRETLAATRARKRAEDRAVAAERAPARVEIREVEVERIREVAVRVRDGDVTEARALAMAADARARDAELRTATAERELRETVALVKGEERRLTSAELAELRVRGPSGPAVLGAALKDLARARAHTPAALPAALTRVASAAVRWRDVLR